MQKSNRDGDLLSLPHAHSPDSHLKEGGSHLLPQRVTKKGSRIQLSKDDGDEMRGIQDTSKKTREGSDASSTNSSDAHNGVACYRGYSNYLFRKDIELEPTTSGTSSCPRLQGTSESEQHSTQINGGSLIK